MEVCVWCCFFFFKFYWVDLELWQRSLSQMRSKQYTIFRDRSQSTSCPCAWLIIQKKYKTQLQLNPSARTFYLQVRLPSALFWLSYSTNLVLDWVLYSEFPTSLAAQQLKYDWRSWGQSPLCPRESLTCKKFIKRLKAKCKMGIARDRDWVCDLCAPNFYRCYKYTSILKVIQGENAIQKLDQHLRTFPWTVLQHRSLNF